MPKVAVITRTRDRALFLRRAIQSVLNQTFEDWVLVVVNDGGAADDVDRVVAESAEVLRGRIKVLHHSASLGMEEASNHGIRESDSDYLVIHDDDDSWQPGFLAQTVAFLDDPHNARFGGVVTYWNVVQERVENGRIVVEREDAGDPRLFDLSLLYLAAKPHFPPISFLYRRKALSEVGLYRAENLVVGDREFNFRFFLRHPVGVIPGMLANYHLRPGVQAGQQGNSVVTEKTRIFSCISELNDEYLRRDLERGNVGMGFLMSLAPVVREEGGRAMEHLEAIRQHLWSIEQLLKSVETKLNNIDGYLFKAANLFKRLPGFRH